MSAGSRTTRDLPDCDWRPGAGRPALLARAALLAELRSYFAGAGVLEVETPLAAAGADPTLQPVAVMYRGPMFPDGRELHLQTSPEFAMKRLLAAGSGPIYQICKAFRNGEAGRLHNPEFSLLEWYRPEFDVGQLIDEVAEVARLALAEPSLSVERRSYADLFRSRFGIEVFDEDDDSLHGLALRHGISVSENMSLGRDGWLDLMFSHLIQPELGSDGLCFVTDFPASQAALACLNSDRLTAARFELFLRGVELANGYLELTDPDEQAARFEAENRRRRSQGLPEVPIDRNLLAALRHGLPECAGVALGLDRLLMLRLGIDDIDQVLSFSLQRC